MRSFVSTTSDNSQMITEQPSPSEGDTDPGLIS